MSDKPDMVERVARAIYEGRNGPKCAPWSNLPKGHTDPYRADARAAIEAMEPLVERSFKAGFKIGSIYEQADADVMWNASVIRASLKEGEG